MAYDVTVLAHLNIVTRVGVKDPDTAYRIAGSIVRGALQDALTAAGYSKDDLVLVEGVSHEVVA